MCIKRRHRCFTSSDTTAVIPGASTAPPTEIALQQLQKHIQQHYKGDVLAFLKHLDPNQQQHLLQTLTAANNSSTSTTARTSTKTTPATAIIAAEASSADSTPTESTEIVVVPEPSARDLQLVTINMAIPFVGFGIMDNSILILAGDMIDTSLGVPRRLGILYPMLPVYY